MYSQNSSSFSRLLGILCFVLILGLMTIFASGVFVGIVIAPAFGF